MQKVCLTVLLVVLPFSALATEEGILFRSDKAEVSSRDIQRYIQENLPSDKDEKALVLNRPEIYRKMAETLYTIEVLAAEAEKMPGFDREQALWNAHVMYQRRIIKDYRESYLKQKMQGVNWEKSAREEYQVNKQQYTRDEMVNVSHILFKSDEAAGDEKALNLANDIRQRALNGEEFAVLAKQYSQDPSVARNSGDLGFFKRGTMAPQFEDAAFAMQEPGTISEVIKSPFGYHVIQFHARKAPEPLPFEAVEKTITEKLKTKMGKQFWEEKLIAIRSDKNIQVDESLLDELRTQYHTDVVPK